MGRGRAIWNLGGLTCRSTLPDVSAYSKNKETSVIVAFGSIPADMAFEGTRSAAQGWRLLIPIRSGAMHIPRRPE